MSNDEERRAAPRERASIAAEIAVDGASPVLGVMLDASATGVQLVTRKTVAVGQPVQLGLQVAGERRVDVTGTIARVERTDPGTTWRFRIGVSLDEPNEELAEIAAAIRARQSR